jgi:hypothetical protein
VLVVSRGFFVLGIALTLVGCGGGGGSSGGPSAGVVDPPPTHTASASQTFTLQNGGSITLNADGSATVASGGTSIAVAPAAAVPGSALTFAGGTLLAHQTGAATDFVLDRMGPSNGLSVSDFGVWNTLDAAGQPTGTTFYAGGAPTAPTLLPPPGSGVTASYSGSYVATLQSPASYAGATIPAGPFSGSAQLTADFGAGSVQAKFGGLLADTFTATSSLDRTTGAYTVHGGTFSPYAAAAYTLNGLFYGAPPAGQAPPETAGSLSGTIGPASTTQAASQFIGSFGAHR